MLSSFALSRAAVSCLASGTDLASCANDPAGSDNMRTAATAATRVMTNLPRSERRVVAFFTPVGARVQGSNAPATKQRLPEMACLSELDEERVLVVAPALTGAVVALVANRLEGGLEGAEDGARFTRRGAERSLDVVHRQLDALRDVGEQLVGALDLYRRQRRGARCVVADRVEVAEDRLHVALDLLRQRLHPARQAAGGDNDPDLHDRDGQGGDRDDAQEDVRPGAHAFSRDLAC